MLTEKEVKELREELDSCKNPLIYFHNDPDGFCSFLLLYKYVGQGKGVIIKSSIELPASFARSVEEYNPDKVFIVDKPDVSQEFLDVIKQPVVWVDHHPPIKRHKVKYFNPRVNDPNANLPASFLCYQAVQENMWISMVGCTGDWVIPEFIDQIKKDYPDLIDKDINTPEEVLFNSKFGKLARILSFCLKGHIGDVKKCINIMTRIKTPYELLNQETPQAKFMYKRFKKIDDEYQETLKDAVNSKTKDEILLFLYKQDRMSLNPDLANELMYKFPEKVIMVGREKSGEVKLSIRGNNYNLPSVLDAGLEGCEGYGGGHEHAVGANVKKSDFDKFLEQFRMGMKK
jgi:single-stranded DNA-specific DHH superfamily exonuclease